MVSNRYLLSPQMREYDRLASQHIWCPYLMFFNGANFRSPVVNTDSQGFRISKDHKGNMTDLDNLPGSNISLFIGGSTAFGVGSTTDGTTIPSFLNERDTSSWVNFGGRAFSSTQELILFMYCRRDNWKIKNIVIFSGINSLYLSKHNTNRSKYFESFFFDSYYHEMMRQRSIRPRLPRQILNSVLETIFPGKTNWDELTKAELIRIAIGKNNSQNNADSENSSTLKNVPLDLEDSVSFPSMFERNIRHWKLLSQSEGVSLTFILQPVATWTGKEYSTEESTLFTEFDSSPKKNDHIKATHASQYSSCANICKAICESHGVRYLDMNQLFAKQNIDKKWLFVDRIHLNDCGYELAANIITQKIIGRDGNIFI